MTLPYGPGSPGGPLREERGRYLRNVLLTGDASFSVAEPRVMIDLWREVYLLAGPNSEFGAGRQQRGDYGWTALRAVPSSSDHQIG